MSAGKLEKMLIEAYKDALYNDKDSNEFVAMFNPEQYSIRYEIESDDTSGSGTSGSSQTFQRLKPQDLSLDFTIDGTGVSGEKVEVPDRVKNFLDVAYEYQGDQHRPRYLKIVWGTLIFKCVLKSANVNYTLFNPEGQPLRAKISASFSGFIEDTLRAAQEDSSSPDLTHMRIVRDGDTLPLMAYNIYGDSKYYYQVAEINGLSNLKKLETGQKIFFPPLITDK
ncbi:MAG TPA: hypothetical protein VIN10_12610 [Bacteroidales bacterium]